MAVELATGYVSIVPSGRGLGRGLVTGMRGAGSQAGDAASASFGSRFTSGLAHVGKRAAQALTVGLGAAAGFGIKVAADFQQTRIAFEGILGDTGLAAKLLGDLRDFAAKTPFEFTDLSTAARQLLAVGIGADDIIPTMETLGNVASTLGVGKNEIEGTVRALGQMKGKGRTSAEELRQISEQLPGFSAIKSIAEGLGVSVADAFKLVESGAVSGDEGMRLILEGMDDFPGAAGAMERQSKTLNGVLSTFRDTLSIMAIDFITPYLPALSRGVQRFSGFLQNLADDVKRLLASEGFKNFKDTVRGIIEDGLEAIRGWWDKHGANLIARFQDLGNQIVWAFALVAGFITTHLMPALADIIGWIVDNEAVFQGLIYAVGTLLVAAWIRAMVAGVIAAATTAAAWLIANAPLAIFIGLLVAAWLATNWLIDKFDLLEKASKVFQFIIDHGIVPLIEQLGRALDYLGRLKDGLDAIGDFFFGGAFSDETIERARRGHGLDGSRANGGPTTPGRWLVGEKGPEVLELGRSGYVYPSVGAYQAAAPGGGSALIGGDLIVQQMPGEDSVSAATRELRRIQLLAPA